jgi:hypothetical protein
MAGRSRVTDARTQAVTPERQLADVRSALERLQACINQPLPSSRLRELFLLSLAEVTTADTGRSEAGT